MIEFRVVFWLVVAMWIVQLVASRWYAVGTVVLMACALWVIVVCEIVKQQNQDKDNIE